MGGKNLQSVNQYKYLGAVPPRRLAFALRNSLQSELLSAGNATSLPCRFVTAAQRCQISG